MARALRQAAHGVHRYLAQRQGSGSLYLVMAAIVAISLGLALPGARDKFLEVRRTLLTTLTCSSQAAQPSADAKSATAIAIPVAATNNATGFLAPVSSEITPLKPKRKLSRVPDDQLRVLSEYISRKYKVAYDTTSVLVKTAHKVGWERRLDPLLLLAVMAVESRYDPYAQSPDGAQGLMQVMTSVHQEKFQPYGEKGPLDPIANINVGATILKDCIVRRGSISGGLACYVGAVGPTDKGYGAKVQAERRQLAALVSGIVVARD